MNSDLDLQLSEHAVSLILAERDAEVQLLLARAKDLQNLSAVGYVARGLERHSLASNELIGMMARRGWTSVEYDTGTPGWRVRWGSFEGYKPVAEIQTLFTV